MAPDLLASIRDELDARLNELRPLLPEYERLLAAAAALDAQAAAQPSAENGAAPVSRKNAAAPVSRKPAKRATRAARVAKPKTGGGRVILPRSAKARSTKQQSGPLSRTQKAILAALEHGSHTPSELVTVSAIGSSEIRTQLSRLLESGKIARINRDSKIAYELPRTAAETSPDAISAQPING
jgi:hypothetical protein